MLTMKYERKDFFGQYQYTEDSKEHYSKEDVKKAFLFISRERNVTVQRDNVIYFWDSIADFENRIMTVRTFDSVVKVMSSDTYGLFFLALFLRYTCF